MKTPGEWELAEADKCLRAAEAAEKEGDPEHAEDLRKIAAGWQRQAQKSVRRAREKKFGLADYYHG